jgi:ectoine hydroxylase-related dioxygenase (phytanoyl-CoA dioxygenase family)
MSEHELKTATAELQRKGYIVLKQKLPEDFCDELLRFALTHPATLRQTDSGGAGQSQATYNADQPRAVIYDFDKAAILSNERVQALLIDPVILSIVQAYLQSEPVADMLSMWWSTAFKGKADGEAAQLYHFDMDRVKWLKVFVYLTDVGADNGPHYFVSGSQRTGGIPQELLEKGYVRLQDEEVARHFSTQDVAFSAAASSKLRLPGCHSSIPPSSAPNSSIFATEASDGCSSLSAVLCRIGSFFFHFFWSISVAFSFPPL